MGRLRRMREADGFTLVEMIVAISLTALVLTFATTAMVNLLKGQDRVSQTADMQMRNQAGMELFTRLLREATYPQGQDSTNSTIITYADPQTVVFTSRWNGSGTVSTTQMSSSNGSVAGTKVSRYVFQLVGTTLKYGSVDPSCSSTPCTYGTPTASKAIVYNVRNGSGSSVCSEAPASKAIFHYFPIAATGSALGPELTTSMGPPVSPVATAQLASIAVVKIEMYTKVNTTGNQAPCEPITDYVNLRNSSS